MLLKFAGPNRTGKEKYNLTFSVKCCARTSVDYGKHFKFNGNCLIGQEALSTVTTLLTKNVQFVHLLLIFLYM